MAPKKPTKITSSSTRSDRAKTGSNPTVTKGEARTRAARTSLGPAPKQRPMATGGTKGPLQGGTRTGGQYGASAPTRPMPSGRGQGPLPNRNMASRLSDKPKPATPRGITMSGDKQAAIKAGGTRPAPKPAFGPVPTGPSERTIRSMEAKPATVKGGMSQQSTLSSKPGANAAANAAKAQAAKDAARMANRVAKGYGAQQTANIAKVGSNLRGLAAGALKTGIRGGAFAAGIQAYNSGDGTLAGKGRGKFANARDMAFAKAKNIKGSPMVGGKKSMAAKFDADFAAARKAGKATFTHMGKKYTTKMK